MQDKAGLASERRGFLQKAAGMALGVAAIAPLSAAADNKKPLIINTLGGIGNPNLQPEHPHSITFGIDARALRDARAAGLSAVNMTIGYVAGTEDPFELSVREIAALDAHVRRYSNDLIKVLGAGDIRNAHASGKVGLVYGFQNAAMMGKDASRVNLFANLGVRVIQLTYNGRNLLGDGAMVPENQGLTPFGCDIVQELNHNKVIVDLSHSGERTCLDAAAASKQPIVISHTGCRAITDLPRNKSDKELRLVAEHGGFVGIYFMPFLAIGRQPYAADLIAHIEHAIKVCGEDHVGLGTDGELSAIDDMPAYMAALQKEVEQRRASGIGATGERGDIVKFLPDLTGPQQFTKLADLLAKRGHSSARVEKILGTNFLRVAGSIWS
jgi:membrane dipeptidase